GRITAADSNHEKLTERTRRQPAALRPSDSREEPDDERSADIDAQCPPGKGLTNPAGNHARKPPPGQAPQATADKNPQCIPHNGSKINADNGFEFSCPQGLSLP